MHLIEIAKKLAHEKASKMSLADYAKQKGLSKEIKTLELLNGISADKTIEADYVKFIRLVQVK